MEVFASMGQYAPLKLNFWAEKIFSRYLMTKKCWLFNNGRVLLSIGNI